MPCTSPIVAPAADQVQLCQQEVIAQRQHHERHHDRRQDHAGEQAAAAEATPRAKATAAKLPVIPPTATASGRHLETTPRLERIHCGSCRLVGEGMDRESRSAGKLDHLAAGQCHRHDDQGRQHQEQQGTGAPQGPRSAARRHGAERRAATGGDSDGSHAVRPGPRAVCAYDRRHEGPPGSAPRAPRRR